MQERAGMSTEDSRMVDHSCSGSFLWTPEEAELKEFKQIGSSACGATAVLNVLSALGWDPLPCPEEANKSVGTRLRQLDAPITEYLLSRSVAGATHDDIIAGIQKLTRGQVIGHFCHMYPSPPNDLSLWLSGWIDKGVVPLATLNLQKAVPASQPVPDAWHHQMIHGVSSSSVFLTNPRVETPLTVINQQLCSESVLLIRRGDVVTRWCPHVKWELIGQGRWAELNVIENVKNMMLEYISSSEEVHRHTHVTIPAAYKSGITLFAIEGSPGAKKIKDLITKESSFFVRN